MKTYFGLTYFIFLLYVYLGVLSDDFQLKLDLSTDHANVGETLTAICHVTKIQSSISTSGRNHYQIIWFKILPESRVEEVEIATNTFLNDDFNVTGRFKAFLQQENPVDNNQVDFFLHIFNVQVEDSGYLGCKIGVPGITAESFKQFIVNVPVMNIWWSSPSSNPEISPTDYKQNESLSFYEGESCNFVCNINGSYPRPQVKIYVGSEDLTRYFTTSSSLIRGSGLRGLQPVYYLLQMSNKSFIIDYRFNEKELKCLASKDDSFKTDLLNDIKSTSIVIRVTEYRPKFFCSRRVLAEFGQFNFTFSCIIRARPDVTHVNVSKAVHRTNKSSWINDIQFRMPFSSNPSTELPGITSTKAVIYPPIDIKNTNPTEKLLTIVIGKVTSEQLGTYLLEAINEVGIEQYEVELQIMGYFQHHTSYYTSTSGQQIQLSLFAQIIICSLQMTNLIGKLNV